MKRRRKSPKYTVSLFPFLAVLICTLGALIVILVIVTKSVDVHAAQAHAERAQVMEQQSFELKTLQRQLDGDELKMEVLGAARPNALARLTATREHRGHLEAEIRKLKQRMNEIAQSIIELESHPVDLDTAAVSESRIEQLKAEIAEAKEALEAKRIESQGDVRTTYSIVPYAGGGGTFRRPIFIECDQRGITLQPLGILLAKSDFMPPLGPGNPLDAAVLAIREYWQQHGIEGSDGSPYPLMVIRPEGSEGYAICRRAMVSWDDEFGYELVEAEKELDFGPVDVQLKQVVEEAIAESRNRQRTMLAARAAHQPLTPVQVSHRAGGGTGGAGGRSVDSRPGLTASGTSGGFVINSAWDRFDSGDESGLAAWSGAGESSSTPNSNFEHSAFQRSSFEGEPGHGGDVYGDSNASTGGGSNAQQGMGAAPPPMSLAKSKGKSWAVPKATQGATAYVRPIRVVCTEFEIEVRSPLGVEKRIPVGSDVAQAVDPLVNEIWRQIESWGMPGERSYWKPELRISVVEGGEANFETLRGLLFDSGIQIKESK